MAKMEKQITSPILEAGGKLYPRQGYERDGLRFDLDEEEYYECTLNLQDDMQNLLISDPSDQTTEDLLGSHSKMHLLYRKKAFPGEKVKISTGDIVNTHALIVSELARRGIEHPPPIDDNGLDESSSEFEVSTELRFSSDNNCYYKKSDNSDFIDDVSKSRYMRVQHSGVIEGAEILLGDVLKHFKTFKLRKPYIYITGGLVNNGKTKGDIDILVNDSEELSEAIKHAIHFRLGRALPPELASRLSIHYNKFYGPFTNYIPIYDLMFERTEDEVKEM